MNKPTYTVSVEKTPNGDLYVCRAEGPGTWDAAPFEEAIDWCARNWPSFVSGTTCLRRVEEYRMTEGFAELWDHHWEVEASTLDLEEATLFKFTFGAVQC